MVALWKILRVNGAVRAVAILSAGMVAALVVAVAALIVDLRQRELNHAKGEIASLSRIVAEQTSRSFEGVSLILQAVQDRLSDDFGKRLELDSTPVQFLLQTRAASLQQHVMSLFVVDRDGIVRNSSRTDFIRNLHVADRDYFLAHQTKRVGMFIGLPLKSRLDGHWAMFVSRRLEDRFGHFRGVVVAAINIGYFENVYDSIGLDLVSSIELLNQTGRLLARAPHQESALGSERLEQRLLSGVLTSEQGDAVVRVVQGGAGPRFVAYRPVLGYPLIIVTGVNEDEALAPWRRTMQPIVIGTTIIILFITLAAFMLIRNLTRRQVLEAALNESDEQLRHMVQSVQDAIVTVDARRRIVQFNAAAERMFAVQAEELAGADVEHLLRRCDQQPQGAALLEYLETGLRSPAGVALFGLVELARDGSTFPVEIALSTSMFHGEILLTAILRDLSERQRAEKELLASNRRLQELSSALQNIREAERSRISRELHDELGQLLTGIRFEVGWMRGRLRPEQSELIAKIGAVKGQIDQTIASVRRISSELRPLVLDDLGFAAAASWYVNQFISRTGLQVSLELPERDPARGGPVATALFRIMQESLTNVARHARATVVTIRLRVVDGDWVLRIGDNGNGLEPDTTDGIGVIGMRERAQHLGGRFAVTGTPGSGTVVEVVVPLEIEERDAHAADSGITG